MADTYLIIGSTGNIGASVVENLGADDVTLRLASRTPERVTSNHPLRKPVYFDYDAPASWPTALEGTSRVFMIPKAGDPYPEKTLIPFMDLAKQSGVERIVFSTAMGLDRDWRVLAAAEDHLVKTGLDFTILRPGWFMQNFTTGFQLASVKSGVIALPGSSACQLSLIDTRDIGACAATALVKDNHIGNVYTLSGPEVLNWEQICEMLSDAAGYSVQYANTPEKPLRDFLLTHGTSPYRVEQMMLMMRSMRDGIYAEVTKHVEEILGRPAISFAQHLDNYRYLLKK